MKTSWASYLTIITIIGAAILFIPGLIWFGLIFPPAVVVLALSPTIALYSLALTFVYIPLKPIGKIRILLSPAIVACIAFTIPYYFNISVHKEISRLTQDDIELSEYPAKAKTIWLNLLPHYSTNGSSDNKCESLCQSLLYNGAFEKVVVTVGQTSAYEFAIEKRPNCPAHINLLDVVARRIAAGECLISKDIPIDQIKADLVYKNEEYRRTSIKGQPFDLSSVDIISNSISLIDTETNKAIFRKTMILARPLFSPLMIDPSTGYNPSLKNDWLRKELKINDYDYDPYKFSDLIFGNFSKEPKDIEQDTKQLIKDSLNSTSSEKVAGHFLIEKYMGDIFLNRKTPTDEDMRLVIAALKDDRVNDWFYLAGFTVLWTEKRRDVPEEYVKELANRILRTGSNATADAIRYLPDGAATIIYPQLQKIAEDEVLRSIAYKAIIRLADGGKKSAPIYTHILEQYKMALDEKDYNLRTEKIRKMGDAPAGSLIGLCNLGKESLPTKELLFQFVSKENPHWIISEMAVDALLQIGLIEELKQRFENNNELWTQIQSAVREKDWAEKSGKKFCGQRII